MGTTKINKVGAVKDAVDRLEWEVAVATDFFGPTSNQAFALAWDGYVHLSDGLEGGRGLRLLARWTNRCTAARFSMPGSINFTFATDLPSGVLDRIEDFRDGRRLHARLEGNLFVLYKTAINDTKTDQEPWIDYACNLADNNNRQQLCTKVSSDSMELTHHLWCKEILEILRPPGHEILEVRLPSEPTNEEKAQRALNHLKEAQSAFDEGRYAETARLLYMASEALNELEDYINARFNARYASVIIKSIRDQKKSVRTICNLERHNQKQDSSVEVPNTEQDDNLKVKGDKIDRPMAHHLLISMKSLAAIYLTSHPGAKG